jgi:hypothetical protein
VDEIHDFDDTVVAVFDNSRMVPDVTGELEASGYHYEVLEGTTADDTSTRVAKPARRRSSVFSTSSEISTEFSNISTRSWTREL